MSDHVVSYGGGQFDVCRCARNEDHPAPSHPCQSVEWDGGEYVPCRRTDTRHHGVGVWLCPEHSNTHNRVG